MNIIEESFIRLYPKRDLASYNFSLKYSGKFSAYNANVKYKDGDYEFALSKQWKGISKEIQIGLIQHLLQKIFKTKVKTLEQDLYDAFLKNVHVAVPKDNVDEELKISYDRVNDQYFIGMVEMPNLVFGKKSFNKLGCYEYGKDTITISQVFRNIAPEDEYLLDYVMFHEMLHKVHKFKTVNGRSFHHTPAFRKAEAEYEGFETIESDLHKFLRKKKVKHYLGLD